MPELPEVETVRRGLEPVMQGARITTVKTAIHKLRFDFPEHFCERLEGADIVGLGRRAKYLTVDLDTGEVLIMHLGMSGSFRIEMQGETVMPGVFHHARGEAKKHDHVVFALSTPSGPVHVIYNDPRRFGYMDLVNRSDLSSCAHFAHMGIEPTGNCLNGEALATLFQGKSAPLKAALLDQRLVAGLGNIYVCEALWRAGLSPRRKAGTLVTKGGQPVDRAHALATHIREVIAEAIEAGGSSLRDHRQTDGSLGYFQHRFSAYDREGSACAREACPGTIKRIIQSGRSTFYCPTCQR